MIHNNDPVVQEVLQALDTGSFEVTDWEARFLDSLMRQTYPLTPKQAAVRGQQRFFV